MVSGFGDGERDGWQVDHGLRDVAAEKYDWHVSSVPIEWLPTTVSKDPFKC